MCFFRSQTGHIVAALNSAFFSALELATFGNSVAVIRSIDGVPVASKYPCTP